MPPPRKIWLRSLLWSGVVLSLAFIMVLLPVFWKRMKAEHILDRIRAEQWSSMSFEKVSEISEKYGGHPGAFGRRGVPCNADSCRFDIVVSNFPMDYLHLAPRTEFSVSIAVDNNHVTEVRPGLLSATFVGAPPELTPLGAVVSENFVTAPSVLGFSAVRRSGDTPGGSIILVHLTASATAQQRQAAYDFNLGCMTKLMGCKHAEDFLPRAAEMATK